jgi:hypothetical protein
MKKLTIGILAIYVLSLSALAVPNQLTYSGRLLQNGALVNAALTMTFKIWNDLTAGTLLWSTSNVNVDVNQGIYSVALDQVSPNVFTADSAYLEVIIDPAGTPETLAPRTRINSVGYALQAGSLTGIYKEGAEAGLTIQTNSNTASDKSNLSLLKRGASNTSTPASSRIGVLYFQGRATVAQTFDGAVIGASTNGATGTLGAPAYLYFTTNDGNQQSSAERMRITETGNVGIGAASPGAKLDVAGTIALTPGGAPAVIRRTVVNGSYGVVLQGNTNDTINDANPGASVYLGGGALTDGFEGNVILTAYGGVQNSSNRNTFRFNRRVGVDTVAESMRIDGAGNVGIGMTNPIYALDVSGNIRPVKAGHTYININRFSDNYEALQWFYAPVPSAAKPSWRVGYDSILGTAYKYTISSYDGTSVTPRLTIDTNGNVGMGNATTPIAKLDVDTGVGDINPGYFHNNNATYAALTAGNSNATGWGFFDQVSARHHLAGSLSIGTTDPGTAKLRVNGDLVSRAQVFKARMSANYVFSVNTWITLPFNSAIFNTLSGTFNTSNYRFTASRAGYYQVSVSGFSSTPTAGGNEKYAIGIAKNGTLEGFTGGNYSSPNDSPLVGFNGIVYMNGTTDYVSVSAVSAISNATWVGSGASPGHEMLWFMNYLGE